MVPKLYRRGLRVMTGRFSPDDEAAEALVAHEHIGAESQHEPRHAGGACGRDGRREIVGRVGLVQPIGGAADLERGVRGEWRVGGEARRVESGKGSWHGHPQRSAPQGEQWKGTTASRVFPNTVGSG
jgi:hypothetical protein